MYEERQYKENQVFDGRVIKVYNDEVVLPDGKLSRREVVKHNGGCSVLPVLDGEYVILVRQYRYAYGEELLEIPAGKLESGEEPRACAIRELKEETGYSSGKITDYGMIYPTPGYTNEKLYIYLAEMLTLGESCPDEGEFLDTVRMPISEALAMVNNNAIKDAKTIVALLKYANGIK